MTTFHATTDAKELHAMYALCGTEWSGNLSADEFADANVRAFEKRAALGRRPTGFYLADRSTKEVLCTAVVDRSAGFYKAPDRLAAILANIPPDASSIGVANVTCLLILYVFTARDHRGKGLAELLIKKVISHTEQQLIDEHLERSLDRPDSFRSMATNGGQVDLKLANYYLAKKYFWYLYLAVGSFYERFGFKAFPLEVYKVPLTPPPQGAELLRHLLLPTGTDAGKKLRLLHRSRSDDRALIEFILQTKELEILTELNKNILHSELLGGRRLLSLLTSMADVLHASKVASATNAMSLASISEQGAGGGRRRLLQVEQTLVPKVALKPDAAVIDVWAELTARNAAAAPAASAADARESLLDAVDVQGAVLTNEMQQKLHYILWMSLMQKRLVVLSMGELKSDFFSALVGPGPAAGGRRRGLSFTGINDLGGINFQDLDILLYAAGHAAHRRQLPDRDSVYVSVNDLPAEIPKPVLHDYFMNFRNTQPGAGHVEFYSDAEEALEVLPMMKRFGEDLPEFELDWTANCMWLWG
jgi:GNAT superfamily N-acetyltransferase